MSHYGPEQYDIETNVGLHRTIVQNNQEYRHKYWATCLSIRLFNRTTHSFACSVLLALLASFAALICLLAPSLTLPSSWDSNWLDAGISGCSQPWWNGGLHRPKYLTFLWRWLCFKRVWFFFFNFLLFPPLLVNIDFWCLFCFMTEASRDTVGKKWEDDIYGRGLWIHNGIV